MIHISLSSRFFFSLWAIFFLAFPQGEAVSADLTDAPAILLVAFGSSMPEAQVSFENIDALVREAYPDHTVRWAFTSHLIVEKIREETGKTLYSPTEALDMLKEDGFTKVAIQSLHSIPGEEYSDLAHIVQGVEGLDIRIGLPLLASEQDVERVADAMLANVPVERRAQDAVVFMGHGTHHEGNARYHVLKNALVSRDSNVFLGTVEGSPTLDDVLAGLAQSDVENVYLVPFMSVAGDHARNDMAGGEPDSWNTIIAGHGYHCVPVLKGTAEYENIVGVWIDHLHVAMQSFN